MHSKDDQRNDQQHTEHDHNYCNSVPILRGFMVFVKPFDSRTVNLTGETGNWVKCFSFISEISEICSVGYSLQSAKGSIDFVTLSRLCLLKTHNKMSEVGNAYIEECKRLRKSILPISQRYNGLTDQVASKNTLYPFVLLLGNHSSGKSSFINHILQRKIQVTGVAPTDDSFTIIGPGDSDIDRNGPALVGDPDLGFHDLKSFGPVLVNHTQLKLRANTAIKDFMIVDSPGMIDSPVSGTQDKTNLKDLQPVGIERGYNFEGVCRWYAERADVILLFFDPDKPGTTGETLSILTKSLVGLDHKLYIILNKADQFKKIHDFARAYGSLCWNLSKVINRKDLPRIHTMCLPQGSSSSFPYSTSVSPTISCSDIFCSPADSNAIADRPSSVPLLLQKTASEVYQSPERRTTDDLLVSMQSNVAKVAHKGFFEQGIHDLEESR
jgi:hypothetical protein